MLAKPFDTAAAAAAIPAAASAADSINYSNYPDEHGRFGDYGGLYVAETLMEPLAELRDAYLRLRRDPEFIAELDRDLKH